MLPFLLILLAFSADRLTKLWAADFLAQNGVTQLHPLLTIVPVYNRGIVFGLLQGVGPLVGWLSVVIVVAMSIYLVRLPKQMWVLRVGLALIVGGALGNLVDRVTAGQVLDFIQTPLRPGVFNIADVMIYLGLALSLGGLLFQRSRVEDSPPLMEIEDNQVEL